MEMQLLKVPEGFRMIQLLKVLEGLRMMEELALQEELMKKAFGHPKEKTLNALGQRHMRFTPKEKSQLQAKARPTSKRCDNQLPIQRK